MHEVVGHRQCKVAPDRARIGIGRIRRADRRPQRGDRTLTFDHERERRARRDELHQLAEERLLPVLGVVRLAELAVHMDELAGPQGETSALDAREDLAGQPSLHGVRLDQDQ